MQLGDFGDYRIEGVRMLRVLIYTSALVVLLTGCIQKGAEKSLERTDNSIIANTELITEK